jgi:hypothetical protein
MAVPLALKASLGKEPPFALLCPLLYFDHYFTHQQASRVRRKVDRQYSAKFKVQNSKLTLQFELCSLNFPSIGILPPKSTSGMIRLSLAIIQGADFPQRSFSKSPPAAQIYGYRSHKPPGTHDH